MFSLKLINENGSVKKTFFVKKEDAMAELLKHGIPVYNTNFDFFTSGHFPKFYFEVESRIFTYFVGKKEDMVKHQRFLEENSVDCIYFGEDFPTEIVAGIDKPEGITILGKPTKEMIEKFPTVFAIIDTPFSIYSEWYENAVLKN